MNTSFFMVSKPTAGYKTRLPLMLIRGRDATIPAATVDILPETEMGVSLVNTKCCQSSSDARSVASKLQHRDSGRQKVSIEFRETVSGSGRRHPKCPALLQTPAHLSTAGSAALRRGDLDTAKGPGQFPEGHEAAKVGSHLFPRRTIQIGARLRTANPQRSVMTVLGYEDKRRG